MSPVREEAPLAGRPQALSPVESRPDHRPRRAGLAAGEGAVAGGGREGGGPVCEKLNPEHSHQPAAFQSVPVGPPLAFHFADWRLCP